MQTYVIVEHLRNNIKYICQLTIGHIFSTSKWTENQSIFFPSLSLVLINKQPIVQSCLYSYAKKKQGKAHVTPTLSSINCVIVKRSSEKVVKREGVFSRVASFANFSSTAIFRYVAINVRVWCRNPEIRIRTIKSWNFKSLVTGKSIIVQ